MRGLLGSELRKACVLTSFLSDTGGLNVPFVPEEQNFGTWKLEAFWEEIA